MHSLHLLYPLLCLRQFGTAAFISKIYISGQGLPDMFDSCRVTRERALTHTEPVSEKRGIFGFGAAKVADSGATKVADSGATKVAEGAAEGAVKKTWGQKLKGIALNTALGLGAAVIGTDIYQKMNPHSKALGDPGPSPPATTGPSTATGPSYVDPTTGLPYDPNAATSPPSSYGSYASYPTTGNPTTSSTYGTNAGYSNAGYPTTSSAYDSNAGYPTTGSAYGYPTTGQSASGTGGPGTRSIAERASEEHALTQYYHSRTSSHKNLLSRADLEKAIKLFTRMLDELD